MITITLTVADAAEAIIVEAVLETAKEEGNIDFPYKFERTPTEEEIRWGQADDVRRRA